VESLFFRVVNARYKEREYVYLKLLESRREENKVKHIQLVNLSNVGHLPADRMKPLHDALSKTLALYKVLVESGPPWCRYLKTSYLLALENAFKVEHRCRDQDLRDVLRQDGKRKQNSFFDEDTFTRLIKEKSQEHGDPRGFMCWLENTTCFVVDSSGLPLSLSQLGSQMGEDVVEFLLNLRIEEEVPEFFLANTCERLYNTFQLMAVLEKEKGYTVKEIFVYKQLTDWSGKPELRMEKMLICGSAAAMGDNRVNQAILSINSLKSHISYVSERIRSITGGNPLPEQDLSCTYFTSSFFYKIFSDIKARHKI